MKRASCFSKEERRNIRSYLNEGVRADNLFYYCGVIEADGNLYYNYYDLPDDVRKELLLMEAKAYLKVHEDATRKERKVVKKWARDGNSVYTNAGCMLQDDGRTPVDFLTEYRTCWYLSEKDPEDIVTHDEYIDYDDLPF